MGTTYPPDGFVAYDTTVWGTHANRDAGDLTPAVTPVTGNSCTKFISSALAGPSLLMSDPATDWIPCQPGDLFLCEGWTRADSTTAGNHVVATVGWYDSAKGYVGSSTIIDTEVTTANVWQAVRTVVTAPATSAWSNVFFGKATGTFNAYWDSLIVNKVPAMFEAWRDVDAAHTSGTVTLDNVTYNFGGCYDGTNTFTARKTGPHAFSAYIGEIDNLVANEGINMTLTSGVYTYSASTVIIPASPYDLPSMNVSATNMWLDAGDTVTISLTWADANHKHLGSGRFYGGELF